MMGRLYWLLHRPKRMNLGIGIRLPLAFTLLLTISLGGCATGQTEMKTVDSVNLEKFMGSWYVIANIPTFLEKDAYNAVETYELNPDGTIATTFTYRKGGFDGKQKIYRPRGFVRDGTSNAVWGMRFIWPFKADYRIVYLDDDYTKTVIGRNKRDYVWIMARQPTIPPAELEELMALVESLGYDTSKVVTVPQRW